MESARRPPLPTATPAALRKPILLFICEDRNPGRLTHPAKRNIIPSIRGSRRQVADIKSGTPAGFKSESVAGFLLESLAGFVGIRTITAVRAADAQGAASEMAQSAFLGLDQRNREIQPEVWGCFMTTNAASGQLPDLRGLGRQAIASVAAPVAKLRWITVELATVFDRLARRSNGYRRACSPSRCEGAKDSRSDKRYDFSFRGTTE
jgi:hypothetical protein